MAKRNSAIIHLIQEINACIDRGKHNDITVKKMNMHIDKGDVFDFLIDNTDMSLSFFKDGCIPTDWISKELLDKFLVGRVRKYYGVENNGLCLLIAFLSGMFSDDFEEELESDGE